MIIYSLNYYYHYYRLVRNLEFVKIRNKPVAPFLADRLELVRAHLSTGCQAPPKSNEMADLCQINQYDLSSYDVIFKEAFQLAYDKFKKHVDNHSALPIFKATRCFDPRYMQAQIERHDITLYRAIKELENPSNELINEWAIYSGLLEAFGENFDLDNYWREKMVLLPNISKIALVYIWLPVSGVDVERSFSAYKRILADNRHALSENSIQMLNFVNFNE